MTCPERGRLRELLHTNNDQVIVQQGVMIDKQRSDISP